jgi:hypothetical protein
LVVEVVAVAVMQRLLRGSVVAVVALEVPLQLIHGQ